MRIKNLSRIKYYLYRSDSKLRMLYPQIAGHDDRKTTVEWKLTAAVASISRKVESNDNLDEDDMLKAVIQALDNDGAVGTVSKPRAYIQGTLPMRWGMYSEYGMREQEDGPLVYFGGLDEENRILLALGGSSKHVMGHEGATGTSSASYTRFLARALWHGIEHGSPLLPPTEDPRTGEDMIYKAVAVAQHSIRPPTQDLEFFAKVLMIGETCNVEPYIGIPRVKVILGTPLYVALASPVRSGGHWGIIPD